MSYAALLLQCDIFYCFGTDRISTIRLNVMVKVRSVQYFLLQCVKSEQCTLLKSLGKLLSEISHNICRGLSQRTFSKNPLSKDFQHWELISQEWDAIIMELEVSSTIFKNHMQVKYRILSR